MTVEPPAVFMTVWTRTSDLRIAASGAVAGAAGEGFLDRHAGWGNDAPMMSPSDPLRQAIEQWKQMLPALSAMSSTVDAIGHAMADCWRGGGKVMFAGNGGSAADAMHFAEELVVRFQKNRRALAAIAMCDPTVLTCVGNDFGYDRVFSRQIEALGKPGDLFVAISTSGNSGNIILAVEAARKAGMKIVGFLGRDGGTLAGLCDLELIAPGDNTARIQEAHKLAFHALCVWIDEVAETL
jgi:D-sedoheptulose 7-phosphate isomerase